MGRDNHQDIVQRLHDQQPPDHTAESVLEFVVRVIAALPRDERAGLERKPAGENIVDFHGVMVSAGRICYPDGQLYKIATDIPATNAPVWNDDGKVDSALYFDITPFLPAATPAPGPAPDPPPAPAPSSELNSEELDRLDHLLEACDRIVQGLSDVRDGMASLAEKIDGNSQQLGALKLSGITAHLRF